MNKCMVKTAAILLALAIILGALGAHALEKALSPHYVESFRTGVTYQFYAAFGLLIVALNQDKFSFSLKNFYRLLIGGMIFFSCSIYILATKELHGMPVKFLGPITPIGGVGMIAAWSLLAVKLFKKES